MIYDFENKSLKSEGKNWIASNAIIIGDIVIKNDGTTSELKLTFSKCILQYY